MMAILIKHQVARRSTSHARGGRSFFSAAMFWLMVGILLGLMGAAGAYLLITQKSIFPAGTFTESKAENPALKPKLKIESKKPEQKEVVQRFEFYQLLPGMEVPILESQDNPAKPTPSFDNVEPKPILAIAPTEAIPKPLTPKAALPALPKPKTAAVKKPQPPAPKVEKKQATPQYVIQAGAFRAENKAKSLRTRLATNGFSPSIQKVEANDGLWYRVVLGPFPSESAALNQKIRLTKHKIQGILILQKH